MEVAFMGETDWISIRVLDPKNYGISDPSCGMNRDQMRNYIGDALDNDRLEAIRRNPTELVKFGMIATHYAKTFNHFSVAKQMGHHFSLVFLKSTDGYGSRVLPSSSEIPTHRTLLSGCVMNYKMGMFSNDPICPNSGFFAVIKKLSKVAA
jgi:hypothetical protein